MSGLIDLRVPRLRRAARRVRAWLEDAARPSRTRAIPPRSATSGSSAALRHSRRCQGLSSPRGPQGTAEMASPPMPIRCVCGPVFALEPSREIPSLGPPLPTPRTLTPRGDLEGEIRDRHPSARALTAHDSETPWLAGPSG